MPAKGHKFLHRFPLGRGCPAAAPGAAHVPSSGGCHRPALSRIESAADTGASRSSGAAGCKSMYLFPGTEACQKHNSLNWNTADIQSMKSKVIHHKISTL